MVTIIGIDLAGSPKRDTGACIIRGREATVGIVHSDEEILSLVCSQRGRKAVGIDAPLSLPSGRKSIDVPDGRHFRGCDIALRARGIRFFPITLGPMRMLTKRGMALKAKLSGPEVGADVFEVYPGATYDVSGVPRRDARRILAWARRFVRLPRREYSQDELDAIAAAITMMLHLRGESSALGRRREGQIIIPRRDSGRRGKARQI